MRTYECPSCGAAVSLVSGAAVFAVCEHCRSMVVRRDVGLEAIGTMAELPPDVTPLRIGSRGTWRGRSFQLLGRVRLAWEDGNWTEWYAEFGDGARGWVAETQGFFQVSQQAEERAVPPSLPAAGPGQSLSLLGETWEVVDRKAVVCVAAEGELPFVARPGATHLTIDLAASDGRFGSLEEVEGERTLYVGAPAHFSELAWDNLQPVPGWSGPEAEPTRRRTRSLACPECAAPVHLRAEGLTLTVVCGSCGALLDANDHGVQIVQRATATLEKLQTALPLGQRGTFGGVPYEIIGLVQRADEYSSWQEYLLFNPWHGFLWLVTYRGHWSLVYRLLSPAWSDGSTARLENDTYRLFAAGKTRVEAVVGEFYWRVRRGEVSEVSDFISPPKVLSKETYPGLSEQTWSAGEYKTPQEIAQAFALPAPLRTPVGPYLNEPNPHIGRWRAIRFPVLLALLGLIAIQLITLAGSGTVRVFDAAYTYVSGAGERNEVSTPTFRIERGGRPLSIQASSPLNNRWLALEMDLVNATSGETRAAVVDLSYYSGTDSDGPWSEGRRSRSVELPAIPAGEYLLRISPSADPGLARQPYSVRIASGGVFWSNFLLSLLAVSLYPIWVLWRKIAFERDRWSESDYSPYSSGDSEDEEE